MAVHHAAFDESGKADREHVIFAGLISFPQRWYEFNNKWTALLEPHGIRYWRTTNAAQLNRQFARFRNHRLELERLTVDLTDTICEYAEGGSVHSVTMTLYNELSSERRNELKDPFYAAFDSGLLALAAGPYVEPTDILTLICDDSEEYSSDALKVYRRFRKLHPDIASRIGGICFQDDKTYPPLQAADLFAFCYRRRSEGKLHGIWAEVMQSFNSTFSVQTPGDLRI